MGSQVIIYAQLVGKERARGSPHRAARLNFDDQPWPADSAQGKTQSAKKEAYIDYD